MASNISTPVLQELPCRSRQKNPFASLPPCVVCYDVAARGGRHGVAAANVNCRFKGFRTIQLASDKSIVAVGFCGDFNITPNQVQGDERSAGSSRRKTSTTLDALPNRPQRTLLHFPHVYDRRLDIDVIAFIKGTCAKVLLPMMRQELAHMELEGAVFLKHEIQFRSLCDACTSELFCGAWFCPSCGLDVCHSCIEALTSSHNPHRNLVLFAHCATGDHVHSIKTMRPCVRVPGETIKPHIDRMALAIKATAAPFFRDQSLPPPFSPRIPDGATTEHMHAPQPLPVYPARTLTRNQFLRLWAAGVPVVITEAQKNFRGHWDPGYFIEHHGKLWVTPIDCETDREVPRMAARDFFALLLKESDGRAVLKLKDWPPKRDFKSTFGTLNSGFFLSIPMECADLVCKSGIFNLAAHFPEGAVPPDLGPKLYIAMGAKEDTAGTTKLHLDVTCAINVMMWSEDLTSRRPGAEWQIFPADSADRLRSFLREEFSLPEDNDPIHQQRYYISHTMLPQLRERYGVSPWTIYQYYGDVVFIPAGCPHQVRNLAHSIKAACDFVSPQNLGRTVKLASSLRLHRIESGSGEDVLQLQALVWFGWMAMCTFEDSQLKPDGGALELSNQGVTLKQPVSSSVQRELASDIVTTTSPGESSIPINRKRPPHLTPNQVKRAKKKAKLPGKPECHVRCPFPDGCSLGSSRLRSVAGTLDHLRDAHPEIYKQIDHQSLKELREMDDLHFVKRLRDLVGGREATVRSITFDPGEK